MSALVDDKIRSMFKSKTRSIVFPQSEHGRLSGFLASLWGNPDFERPILDFTSFVQGVAFHDWGYGLIDNVPIGEVDEAEWLVVTKKGIDYHFDDPVADILAKLHLKRLLCGRSSHERALLVDCVETRIEARIPETNYSREQFEWADRITRFCDSLAFDFCFEWPVEISLPVYASTHNAEETQIRYRIAPGGEICFSPWPFSVNSFSGNITAYKRDGYPNQLNPLVVPFKGYPDLDEPR